MSKVITYGGAKTVHQTEHLDIETDIEGGVIAVWYRCMRIPFKYNVMSDQRREELEKSIDSTAEGILGMVLRVKS